MNEIKFRQLVKEMLETQQTYFKGRKQSDLIKSKELEKRVRQELAAGPDQAASLTEQEYQGQLSLLDEANRLEQEL